MQTDTIQIIELAEFKALLDTLPAEFDALDHDTIERWRYARRAEMSSSDPATVALAVMQTVVGFYLKSLSRARRQDRWHPPLQVFAIGFLARNVDCENLLVTDAARRTGRALLAKLGFTDLSEAWEHVEEFGGIVGSNGWDEIDGADETHIH